MLRPVFLLLFFLPLLSLAQKPDRRMIKALQTDIGILAGLDMEGRMTGSEGERKAADYLVARYEKLKIPAWGGAYRHPFSFVYGIEVNDSRIVLGGQSNLLGGEAFPMPFSGNGAVSGDVLIEVQEQGAIWMLPLYESAGQAADAGFNWQESAWKAAKQAVNDGATGIVFYDGYGAKQPLKFDPLCKLDPVGIPVALVGYRQWKELSANDANVVSVALDIRLSKPERKAENVVAWIDNKAPKTIVIGANYDHIGGAGKTESGSPLFVNGGANDNASGTAAVLQLAERLKRGRLRKYNYVFAHFSGHHLGQLGSKALCKEARFDASQVAFMIDLYKIGNLSDSLQELSIVSSPQFTAAEIVSAQVRKAGFRESKHICRGRRSDFQSFSDNGIPSLSLTAAQSMSFSEYMKDYPSKINYPGASRIVILVESILKQLEATAAKH